MGKKSDAWHLPGDVKEKSGEIGMFALCGAKYEWSKMGVIPCKKCFAKKRKGGSNG